MAVDILPFERCLVEKYDRPGPRYTSYPTAPHFHEAFGVPAYREALAISQQDNNGRPLSVYVHVPCRLSFSNLHES